VSLLLDIGYLVAALLAIPWFAYRFLARGDTRNLALRFGFGLGAETQDSIWLHGSSAGEIALLVPLVELIERSGAECPIVISAYSSTGLAAARKSFSRHRVIVFPFDLSFVVKRFLARLRPRLIVIVESEFWPNFLRLAHRRGVPVIVVNGKISEQSLRRYARLRIFAAQLRQLAALGVQGEVHAARFRSLGVPAERIRTTGNMKYDLAAYPNDVAAIRASRQRFGYADSDIVIIGGSVHDREDAMLIAVFVEIRAVHPNVRLIIVPRYPADCGRAEQLLRTAGCNTIRKSTLDASPEPAVAADDVMLVDTVGDLRFLYGFADIAFVGGSLFFRGGNKGGHNLMEPAVYGIPVLFGPYNTSFAETARALDAAGGGFEVVDQRSLQSVLESLVCDATLRARSGRIAKNVIDSRRGATRQNFELLLGFLDPGIVRRLRDPGRNSTMPPTLSDPDSP